MLCARRGKRFAFTVYDDTDAATLENVGEVYALCLRDPWLALSTETCWPLRGNMSFGKNANGQTCQDVDYRDWLLGLQAKGFEMAWHGASWQSSLRGDTIRGLECFRHFDFRPLSEALCRQPHGSCRRDLLGGKTADRN